MYYFQTDQILQYFRKELLIQQCSNFFAKIWQGKEGIKQVTPKRQVILLEDINKDKL